METAAYSDVLQLGRRGVWLIGSTEWVEEKRRWLINRAVAYLNLDTVLQGNYTFDVSATPSLKAAAMRAASKVKDPHKRNMTVLDVWKTRVTDARSPGQPWIRRPVSITDFQPFVHLLGVPVTHSRYSFVEEDGMLIYPIRNFPLYHTVYDTLQLAEMMDPAFAISSTVTAIMAELTRDLADSLLLPLAPVDYALDLLRHLKVSMENARAKFNASVSHLQLALEEFYEAASTLQSELDNLELYTVEPFQLRRLNDKLMLFERAFVNSNTGHHLFLSYGSNSKPSLDQQTLADMIQALRAATLTLST